MADVVRFLDDEDVAALLDVGELVETLEAEVDEFVYDRFGLTQDD